MKTNYRVTDEVTDVEMFSNGEDCVVISWDGETKVIETFTSGTSDALYCGSGMEAARKSLQLSEDDWNSLLMSDCQYLEPIQ